MMILEDVESFALLLVRDFLKRKQLPRTLAVFDAETKTAFPETLDDALATDAWLTMSQRVGISKISFQQKCSALESVVVNATKGGTSDHRENSQVAIRSKAPRSKSARSLAKSEEKEKNRTQFLEELHSVKAKRKPRKKQNRPRPRTPPKLGARFHVQSHSDIKASLRRPNSIAALKSKDMEDGSKTKQSSESWIPLEIRMRMLRRDIQIAKINQQNAKQIKEIFVDKDKRRGRAVKSTKHALTRTKRNEELLRRTRKDLACALCEMQYPTANLPFWVSYKAIIDLRLSWGVEVESDTRYSRFPHWYKPVQVCIFCSQFFQLSGGLFDSDRRGLLKTETLTENDKHTLQEMGLHKKGGEYHKRGSVHR